MELTFLEIAFSVRAYKKAVELKTRTRKAWYNYFGSYNQDVAQYNSTTINLAPVVNQSLAKLDWQLLLKQAPGVSINIINSLKVQSHTHIFTLW